jgi:hypothetical protein
MTLHQLTKSWTNTPESHQAFHQVLTGLTNANPQLKAHRDWVEQNIFGFGERSFHYLWKLLCDEMPHGFRFLEIGVFRGQILSLIRLLRTDAIIEGVSPLDSTDGHWHSDYAADIRRIHDQFELPKTYKIHKGLSTDHEIIATVQAQNFAPQSHPKGYEILYIDGGHTYPVAKSDIENYAPLIKPGGYLVIDDCCNDLNIPQGMFPGIAPVTIAVKDTLPNMPEFKFLFSLVHIKVYQKSFE